MVRLESDSTVHSVPHASRQLWQHRSRRRSLSSGSRSLQSSAGGALSGCDHKLTNVGCLSVHAMVCVEEEGGGGVEIAIRRRHFPSGATADAGVLKEGRGLHMNSCSSINLLFIH
eukprot:GHVU01142828.1.p2 GENE.GHVU01142828.1~~GHVU01142828.1.p2  ORF type:complete len:115 (-),score=10.61 GHVU01142828.1:1888-2232(-)